MRKTLEERFWEKVDKKGADKCWEWMGTKSLRGYGSIKINGKGVRAHRFSWEIHNGPIPEGMFVLHHCDNPSCVNPAHLFLGTHADNMKDMVAKGRQARERGEANRMAKLTEQDVRKIRALIKENILAELEISEKFNVAPTTIRDIKHGQNWGWLDASEEDNENDVD